MLGMNRILYGTALGLLPLMAGAVLLCSCVRDDRDGCLFPLRLRFSYTYNREHRDLFGEEVDSLRLYLFDACCRSLVDSATMASSALDSGDVFVWKVPPGDYDVVAWGGPGSAYPAHVDGTLTGSLLSVRTDSEGYAAPRGGHLWYGIVRDMSVLGDIREPDYGVDMRKYSNRVRVEVSGIPTDAFPRLQCTLEASNGAYGFDGEECGDSPVSWRSVFRAEGSLAVHEFVTLRLREGDDSRLRVAFAPDPGASALEIYSGSLSGLLAANPALDLDLDDEFTVRLAYRPGSGGIFSVAIYVNGWHVVDLNSDI